MKDASFRDRAQALRLVLSDVDGVRIDMAPGFDSLNVATTAGIVLHHLSPG